MLAILHPNSQTNYQEICFKILAKHQEHKPLHDHDLNKTEQGGIHNVARKISASSPRQF